jgi:hypothetical protein
LRRGGFSLWQNTTRSALVGAISPSLSISNSFNKHAGCQSKIWIIYQLLDNKVCLHGHVRFQSDSEPSLRTSEHGVEHPRVIHEKTVYVAMPEACAENYWRCGADGIEKCQVPEIMVLPHLSCSTFEQLVRKERRMNICLQQEPFLAFHSHFFPRLYGDRSDLHRRKADDLCDLPDGTGPLPCLPTGFASYSQLLPTLST